MVTVLGVPVEIDLTLDAQLDVDGSAGDLPEIAYRWLDGLLTVLAERDRAALAGLPAQPSAARKGLTVEDLFGTVKVTRMDAEGDFKAKARTLSDAGLRWLRAELRDLPFSVHIELGRLDEFGRVVNGEFSASVHTYEESPGWLRLGAYVEASRFSDPRSGSEVQRRWLTMLREFADEVNPGFGHLTYLYHDGCTALETYTDGRAWGSERRGPDYMIGRSREWLRGYSWLTVVPEELAAKVGGVEALAATGAFVRVERLRRGGVWLLATEDFRDYSGEVVERVFRALAPILPPGEPMNVTTSPVQPPALLVYADPRAVG